MGYQMNILYYLKNYPKLSQSFVLNEISELKRRGHNIAVFARQDPGEDIQHDEYDELDVSVRYAERPTIADGSDLLAPEIINRRVLHRSLYRAHLKNHAKNLHLARQCIEYVDELGWELDLIHSHFAHPNKLPATYVAAYYGIPCTVTAHAYEIFQEPNVRMLHILFDRIDRVIVPSRYNRSYLREHFDIEKPIDVVPATTQVSKFEPTDQEVPGRILTVARLVEKKGVIYAIEAIARLAETYPEIEYHIVGTGEREEMLRQRAAELGVEDRVTFLGRVSDERLYQELDDATIFVLPSVITGDGDRDSSPVALKEAMAMATPCVSTTVAGIPEIVTDGSDGRLVEPRNVKELTEALAGLLADDDNRQAMGRQARESVITKFGLETAVDELVKSFQAAIDANEAAHSTRL
ncbi:glycosyltransferase [Saliphagus sp. LR7]|uniref:glycosyltransferase n=1 Tax=Saliphagus sp. LR7 TaxID=2282654 RepID=UPI000DF84011|nr:glycosyltransferase [Saliphagus sp. LR7]